MSRPFPLSDQEYRAIYSKANRLVVGLVIKNEKGILLTKRRYGGWVGYWHLPGGMLHYRESIDTAIQRLAQEELGVEIKNKKLLGYIEYPSEEQERGFGHSVGLIFQVDVTSQEFPEGDYDEKDFFPSPPPNTIKEELDLLSQNNLFEKL